MDYLGAFRAKVGRLRVEIAEIQELNQQFWRDGRNGAAVQVVQVAYEQRSERLQAIQHELGQLARLGSGVILAEQVKENRHLQTHLVKRERAA
jgi:hypothetical protein